MTQTGAPTHQTSAMEDGEANHSQLNPIPRALPPVPGEQASIDLMRRVRAAASVMPKHKAERHKALILDRTAKYHYRIGMLDPYDVDAQEDIARALKTSTQAIKFERLEPMLFDVLFRHAYEGDQAAAHEEVSATRTTSSWTDGEPAAASFGAHPQIAASAAANIGIEDLTDLEEYHRNIKRNPWELSTREFVRLSLMEFIRARGSDAHFEAATTGGRVRFRTDGVLFARWKDIPPEKAKQINSALASMGGLFPADMKFRPLNSTIKILVLKNNKPEEVELRFSSSPTAPWPEVVLRSQSDIIDDLNRVGLLPQQIEALATSYTQPQGIILITGPTGSGKTNTQAGIFNELQRPDNIKIIENADPVEVYSDRRSQIPITKTTSLMDAFHSNLRQDPDVIAIGELRSVEFVNVALDAALTGHLVLATYHTTDVEKTFTRLFKMGVPRELLADGLNAIHSQRLVRLLCEECKQIDSVRSEAFGRIVYEARGCPVCYGLGYKGRTAVAEVLMIRDEIKGWIADGTAPDEIVSRSINNGWMISMRQVAGFKMQSGLTSFKEIQRVMKISYERSESFHQPSSAAEAASTADDSPATARGVEETPEETDYVDVEFVAEDEASHVHTTV